MRKPVLGHAPLPRDLIGADIDWGRDYVSRRPSSAPRGKRIAERRAAHIAENARARVIYEGNLEIKRRKQHRQALVFESRWQELDQQLNKALAYGQPLRANRTAIRLARLELDHAAQQPGDATHRGLIAGLRARIAVLKREQRLLKEKGVGK